MKNLSLLFITSVVFTACTPAQQNTNEPTPPLPPDTMESSSLTAPYDGDVLSGKHTVIMHTDQGDITLELDADVAPKTVTNFVVLSQTGYYDGLTFHRIIPGFMIQGGDPNGNGTGGRSIYGEKFEDEIDPDSETYEIGYKTGVIAMANAGPNTNGSQFFIMDADYPLPPNYTIFGKVTEGQETVSAIAQMPRGGPQNDQALEPVSFTMEIKE